MNVSFQTPNTPNSVKMVTVQSEPSNPFVVITNENQYGDALHKLFQEFIFTENGLGGVVRVCRNVEYENYLQLFLLVATKQHFAQPTRFFTPEELSYLILRAHQQDQTETPKGKKKSTLAPIKVENEEGNNSNSDALTRNESERIWELLGPILRALRYQKQWLELFNSRLIMGFMNRETSQRILLRCPKAHFLLRFSDSNPGMLTISYRANEESNDKIIKHYLIKDEDIAKKTVSDFLRSRSELQYILQSLNGSDLELTPGALPNLGIVPLGDCWVMREARILSKELALGRYFKQRNSELKDEDYDDF